MVTRFSNGVLLVALIVFTSCVVLAVAAGATAKSARGAQADTQVERALRDSTAKAELSAIVKGAAFRTYLPTQLPVGDTYDVVQRDGSSPNSGFAVFVAGPRDAHRAIHMDQAPVTPQSEGSPKNPLKAFAGRLQPMTLANGTWYAMQQDHQPWKGNWILMTVLSGTQIEVDGPGPRDEIAAFAGSLALAS